MAKKKPLPATIEGPLTGRIWKLDQKLKKYGKPTNDFKTWTRQELIDHINTCADQWHIPRVKNIEKCSDEALRRTVAGLFREGRKLGTHQ